MLLKSIASGQHVSRPCSWNTLKQQILECLKESEETQDLSESDKASLSFIVESIEAITVYVKSLITSLSLSTGSRLLFKGYANLSWLPQMPPRCVSKNMKAFRNGCLPLKRYKNDASINLVDNHRLLALVFHLRILFCWDNDLFKQGH